MESQRSKDDRHGNDDHRGSGLNYDAMRSMEARMTALARRQDEMGNDVMAMKLSMDANTAALKDYIDLSKKLKVGLSILAIFERVSVWVTKVSLAAATTWGIWKFIVHEAIARSIR